MHKSIFILLPILLLPMCVHTNEKLNIILKDNNFDEKDKIEFRVCNERSDEEIEIIDISVEKRIKGKWLMVDFNIECPCETYCDNFGSVPILQKGQCEEYSVNLENIKFYCDENKLSGEYRLIIEDYVKSIDKLIPLGVSESFFIK